MKQTCIASVNTDYCTQGHEVDAPVVLEVLVFENSFCTLNQRSVIEAELFSSVMETSDTAFIFMNNKSMAQTTVVDSVLQFYKSLFGVSRVWFLSIINKMPIYILKLLSPLVC